MFNLCLLLQLLHLTREEDAGEGHVRCGWRSRERRATAERWEGTGLWGVEAAGTAGPGQLPAGGGELQGGREGGPGVEDASETSPKAGSRGQELTPGEHVEPTGVQGPCWD